VHGPAWSLAWQSVKDRLEALIPRAGLNAEFERGAAWVDRQPVELFQRGSGWGALERLRREAAGEPPFCSEGLIFDQGSLGEEQAPWIALLHDGALSKAEPEAEPRGYVVQAEWRMLLEDAVKEGRGAHWTAWLHLGLMQYHAGERDAAHRAWETALERGPTPWAMRNLAVLAPEEGRLDAAVELYAAACPMRPALLPLAVECGRALIGADRAQEWLALLAELPESIRTAGRIRLLEGQAALAVKDFRARRAPLCRCACRR